MTAPVCTIVAGPNGAGKTTFALNHFRKAAAPPRFVNADLIAAGLSPLAPDAAAVAAGRLFLSEIEACVLGGADFAFETTLAGRGHLRLVRRLRSDGWTVLLVYLWLPDVSMALARVAERVRHGGHDVPEAVIRRRFRRSVRAMLDDYLPMCDLTTCIDNSRAAPKLIFTSSADGLQVVDPERWRKLEAMR